MFPPIVKTGTEQWDRDIYYIAPIYRDKRLYIDQKRRYTDMANKDNNYTIDNFVIALDTDCLLYTSGV